MCDITGYTISGNLPTPHPEILKWVTCGKSHFASRIPLLPTALTRHTAAQRVRRERARRRQRRHPLPVRGGSGGGGEPPNIF